MGRTATGRRFNPERYGMIYCPVCKGSGKLFNGVEEGGVCKTCGGFGLIKKEAKNVQDNWAIAQFPK